MTDYIIKSLDTEYKIPEVDIQPDIGVKEWKFERVPEIHFTCDTQEWFKEKLETEWKFDE